jgi:spore coat protein CotF
MNNLETVSAAVQRSQALRASVCGRVPIAGRITLNANQMARAAFLQSPTARTGSLRKEFKKILREAWQVARIMMVEMIRNHGFEKTRLE